MSEILRNKLEDFIKDQLVRKNKPSLEKVFEETLKITTPSQPGDLRSTRKWKDIKEDESEWL